MTKTFCILQVSRAAFDEIRQRVIDAGAPEIVRNGHVFMDEIAIEPLEKENCPTCGEWVKSIFDHVDKDCVGPELNDFEKGEIVRAVAIEETQVRTAWRVFSELEDRGFKIVKA